MRIISIEYKTSPAFEADEEEDDEAVARKKIHLFFRESKANISNGWDMAWHGSVLDTNYLFKHCSVPLRNGWNRILEDNE